MARAGLARTPSTILTVSTVLISSSIFETELAIGEYWSEGQTHNVLFVESLDHHRLFIDHLRLLVELLNEFGIGG